MTTADHAAFLERAAAVIWGATHERTTGVRWDHAGPYWQRLHLRMAAALHTAGLIVDPAIGRDLNALQRLRDGWRIRAEHAEAAGKLDRERANAIARESAAAWAKADELQRQLDDQSEGLEAARDQVDELQRVIDLVTTWAEGGAQLDNRDAQAVLNIVRPPET